MKYFKIESKTINIPYFVVYVREEDLGKYAELDPMQHTTTEYKPVKEEV